MNVTEKQKQILINFMRSHPDFGRGRLRYNKENKKKIDELWEEITASLNSAGCGPQKLSKEWAKTWRDWKSNLLKRVATYKSYAGSTGGGPPKVLDTSPSEDDLLDFLTPEASGMSEIPEGGAIDDNFSSNLIAKKPLTSQNWQTPITQTTKDILASQSKRNLQTTKTVSTLCSQRPQNVTSLSQIDIEENFFYNDVNVDNDAENVSINISDSASVENEEISKQVQCNLKTMGSTMRYSDDKDTSNKKRRNVKNILEQHTVDYSNTQERMLQLKEEELAIEKEKLQFLKDSSQEQNEHFITLIEKVERLTNTVQSFAPQYLD